MGLYKTSTICSINSETALKAQNCKNPMTLVVGVVKNWLNQKQQLDRAKEIRKNDSLDNPCNGFLSDWDAPTFSVISVKVFVCEYCD